MFGLRAPAPRPPARPPTHPLLFIDKASNADDDADYMENFDHKDGDAIFRSPIGSTSGSLDGNNTRMSPSSPLGGNALPREDQEMKDG